MSHIRNNRTCCQSQLSSYCLISNSLLSSHQSVYCRHHSTETALLYIHDHLINAIGSQKLSCLCLLALSAASNSIDHNILITRLSSSFPGFALPVILFFPFYACKIKLTTLSFQSMLNSCSYLIV